MARLLLGGCYLAELANKTLSCVMITTTDTRSLLWINRIKTNWLSRSQDIFKVTDMQMQQLTNGQLVGESRGTGALWCHENGEGHAGSSTPPADTFQTVHRYTPQSAHDCIDIHRRRKHKMARHFWNNTTVPGAGSKYYQDQTLYMCQYTSMTPYQGKTVGTSYENRQEWLTSTGGQGNVQAANYKILPVNTANLVTKTLCVYECQSESHCAFLQSCSAKKNRTNASQHHVTQPSKRFKTQSQ